MADFNLQIISQTRKVYDGDVTALTVPAEDGYLGVLAHHAPMVAALGEGKLTLRRGDRLTEYTIDGGFLEVSRNQATLLVDQLLSDQPADEQS